MIQVAGIHDLDEARLVLAAGATHLGFPLRLPVNQEDCSEAEAAALIGQLGDQNCAVLITYLDDCDQIIAFCKFLGVSMVQLHGEVSLETLRAIKQSAPWLRVIKSLVVGKSDEVALLEQIRVQQDWVDFFITDTFNPITGASGATGCTHDWALGRRLVSASAKPVIIAGGLRPDNVAEAVEKMQPYGVDVHSGVEGSDGRKCANLVRAFCDRARAALAKL